MLACRSYLPLSSMRISSPSFRFWIHRLLFLVCAVLVIPACSDDTERVREIQLRRQAKQQEQDRQDHLGATFDLLRQYIELEPQQANRQMAYHLNRWSESRPAADAKSPSIAKTLGDVIPKEKLIARVEDMTFRPEDAYHLRDSFVFRRIFARVDVQQHDERLLEDWFKSLEGDLGSDDTERLRTASRLFDWTVRNIALEPDEMPVPQNVRPPKFPLGMKLNGRGYRQTDYQSIFRGIGDGMQRAGVFTQLCRQADIPAAVLATIDSKTGALNEFCVGVLIAKDIYLFEPTLGIFVPGPDQVGIATLGQARRDAVILRRLGIAGLDQFKYPVEKEDVQQCAALLNLKPACLSPRMSQLQNGLTGNRRMNVYVDADAVAKQFDDVTGVGTVRLWTTPMLADVYSATCQQVAERDPLFGFWHVIWWAMLEADIESSKTLSKGRWLHLLGEFADDDLDGVQGARTLYLSQRAPEFEIEDLQIDVELQLAYGIRRDLGVDSATYQQQVAQVQRMMQMGKRTATYWLSLLQDDDGRTETAESWFRKRVMNEEQSSRWVPSARYNMARLAEKQGNYDEAIELYKLEKQPQEHGNRIRARLLAKQRGS